jgi:hypothetical protein
MASFVQGDIALEFLREAAADRLGRHHLAVEHAVDVRAPLCAQWADVLGEM